MSRYTVIRQTADIDVVVEVARTDAERIIDAFEGDYYVPVNAVRNPTTSRKMFNLIHLRTAFKVDCIVKQNDTYSLCAFGRRSITDYFGHDVWIISKEDLIVSKLQWANIWLSNISV